MMWKDFFYYSRNEQRGIVVLLILILIVIAIRISLPFILLNQEFTPEEIAYINQINAINDSITAKEKLKDSLFCFNPNIVSEEEMKLLGFNSLQRKSLIGYRNKVGKIISNDDLLKIYGVDTIFINKYSQFICFDQSEINELIPKIKNDSIQWIDFNHLEEGFLTENISTEFMRDSIESRLVSYKVIKRLPLYQVRKFSDEKLLGWIIKNSKPKYNQDRTSVLLELNTADTTMLKEIKGIGSVLSNRIIKYRKLLGGYVGVEQLKEVYGYSDELYGETKRCFYVDVSLVKKKELTIKQIDEICKHPYFSRSQVIELINLKRKKTNLSDIKAEELENISEKEWVKMKMYLDTNVESNEEN